MPSSRFELHQHPTCRSAWQALVREVYAPVFEVVDATSASQEQLNDAFRHFTPAGQRGRMVTLFTGLMEYAEMINSVPKQRPGPKPGPEEIAPSPSV